jgi:apolipoprotein N-acyltransferase
MPPAAPRRRNWPRAQADWPLAFLLGALHSLPFVYTALWPLQMLVVAVLGWQVAAASPGRAAWLGLAFGSSWMGCGTWWLFISLYRYGGLPAWMAVLAVAALCVFLSLFLAAAMAAFARWRTGRPARDAVLFAALWLLAELARGTAFTGFPWLASGYAHVDAPLAVLAPWLGVYGIGAVAAGLAVWPRWEQRDRVAVRAGPWLAVLALLVGARTLPLPQFTEPARTLSVTLLQGNVPQDEKFAMERMPQALAWAAEKLLASRSDLVLAPETVIPLLPSQLDAAYWSPIVAHFRQGTQAALLGLPLGDDQLGYTNSAAGLSAGSASAPGGYYRYDKHHLVPFGEFIPTGFHWFTRMMNIPLGDFNRGPVGPASFAHLGERIGANICYEDLFGEELAARFHDPARAPTLFANLSNIGWFGNTIAIDQHLQISRMRALEFQRPMLRATNTGATAVIDHHGTVTHQLPRFTQGVLEGQVQGRTGLTPYAWWASRMGLWLPGVLGLGLAAAAARRRGPGSRRVR